MGRGSGQCAVRRTALSGCKGGRPLPACPTGGASVHRMVSIDAFGTVWQKCRAFCPPARLGRTPIMLGIFPMTLGITPTPPCPTLRMLHTTRTMLGTTHTMLGTILTILKVAADAEYVRALMKEIVDVVCKLITALKDWPGAVSGPLLNTIAAFLQQMLRLEMHGTGVRHGQVWLKNQIARCNHSEVEKTSSAPHEVMNQQDKYVTYASKQLNSFLAAMNNRCETEPPETLELCTQVMLDSDITRRSQRRRKSKDLGALSSACPHPYQPLSDCLRSPVPPSGSKGNNRWKRAQLYPTGF